MTVGRFRTTALLIAISPLIWSADSPHLASAHESATFTAPDDSFRFSYPNGFEVCTTGKIQPCVKSMIPACDPDALVCVVYPVKQFGDTNLDAAAFQVRDILASGEQMTADICATPYPRDHGSPVQYPDFLISAEHTIEVIGGVRFIHGARDGVATGSSIRTELYRAFHNQTCFELSVGQTGTDPSLFDPPKKTLTPAQQKKLDLTLSHILHSFRFTR
jgi:hypothetical protein